MAVNWKLNVSVTTILLIAAVIFVFVSKPFNCGSKPSHLDWVKVHTELENLGYKPAAHSPDPKPDDLPPAVKQNASSTVTGSGTWIPAETYTPDDTVAVELTEVTLGDGTHWIKLLIDSTEVKWHRLEHYHAPLPERKWTLFVEAVNCESRVGMGIGYRVFTVAEVNVSPALSISTQLDWVAGELRLSRNIFSGVAFGGGAGYRFGTDDGLHLSAGLSIEL